MRRTATAALTAALMLTGTSAALAQPGPPSDIPAPPAQAQGSPATGEDRSAEARENAAPQGSPATGQERSAEARENAAPQGSPATGQERSAEARAHASERSGVTVPASEEAREGGRDFGEQRAAAARARGEQENDATENAVDGDDLEVDGLDDVDLPEQGDEARGVLTTITESVTSLLNTIKSLFGF